MEKTVQQAVAEKIQQRGPDVFNIVVDKLAEVEITRRVDLISVAIKKQDELETGLKKIDRNDVITYLDGVATEVMSKNRFEELKKSREKLENLKKAIDLALTDNSADSYNKLSETLKKVDGGGNQAQSTGSSE
jgi:hypothetical protein